MAYKVFAKDIAAPFSHMVFYSEASLLKKVDELTGIKGKKPIQILSNFKVDWSLEEDNSKEIEEKIIERLANPAYYQMIVKNSYISLKEFKKAASSYKSKNFDTFSNRQLVRLVNDYIKIWKKTIIWGHIVNFSDFHFNLLSRKVIGFLKEAVKKNKLAIFAPEAFTLLSTPLKESLIAKEEKELLEITAEVQSKKETLKIFQKKDLEIIKKELKKFPRIFRKIKRHTERYDWLQYHYLGPTILNIDYFLELIASMVRQNIEAKKKIKDQKLNKLKLKKRQKELIKKLKLGKKEIYWLRLVREFIYLKALRKEITFMACRGMDSLLKELAKRLKVSLRQLQLMTPEEVFRALLKGKRLPESLLNERRRYCVVYYPKGKAKIYTGKKAKKLAKKVVYEKVLKEIKEIKGTSAYPGKVRGEVKIISNAEEMGKMQKGDILVSPATNPNIMLAIKKAAAIITDEGGITCHAAIVSRELKIPCVIGTKIATQVLKDGDRVEVDANKGIVKKLKLLSPAIYDMMLYQKATLGRRLLKEFIVIQKDYDNVGSYGPIDQLRCLIEATMKVIIKNPARIERVHQKAIKYSKDYFNFARKLQKIDLRKLSNRRLGQLFDRLNRLQIMSHGYAICTTWFVDSDGEDFTHYLFKKVEDFIKAQKLNLSAAEVFSLLTTPEKASLVMKEELESFKILATIKKDRTAKKIFLQRDVKKIERDLEKLKPKLRKSILSHYHKWRWMPYTYIGPAYNLDFYLSTWSGLLRERINIKNHLQKLKNQQKEIKLAKDRLIKKLKISRSNQRIFNIAAEIIYLKAFRKDCWFFGGYVLEYLHREIARRLNLSLKQVRFMTFWEVTPALIKGYFSEKILNERIKFSVLYQKGLRGKIFSGQKAKKFLAGLNLEKEKIKAVNEFKGTSAHPGQAKGVVKIVNLPEEIKKMKKDNIMVAHTTFPSLVPAMKKAAALVTDDGGLTCHAAIVSRELGIPCIVGTKIASKVLKDGDKVKVDATKGIVIKLNKK